MVSAHACFKYIRRKMLNKVTFYVFFGTWCMMFGFIFHDVTSNHKQPTPQGINPVLHMPFEKGARLKKDTLNKQANRPQKPDKMEKPEPPQKHKPAPPIRDIEDEELLFVPELKISAGNQDKNESKVEAKQYIRAKQKLKKTADKKLRYIDAQRVASYVLNQRIKERQQQQQQEQQQQWEDAAEPIVAPRKATCQAKYVLSNLNENWFDKHEHVDLLKGCQALFYNRVPKCGSRSVLETFKYLAKTNAFTVHDKATPYGGNRSHLDLKSDLANFIDSFSRLEKPYLYVQHIHHVDFGVNTISTDDVPVYINLVRDPVERFISHYYYLQYGSKNADPGTTNNTGMSLDKCIESQDANRCLNRKDFIPFFCGHDGMCRRHSGSVLARTRLVVSQQYLVIGLTEDISSFLFVLETLMPHMFKGAVTHFNQTEKQLKSKYETVLKPEVKESSREYLKVLLRHEIDLFNFMRQRFYSLLNLIKQSLNS